MFKKILAVGIATLGLSLFFSNKVEAVESVIPFEDIEIEEYSPNATMTVTNLEYHTTYASPGSFPLTWNTSVVGNNGVVYSGNVRLQRTERINGTFRGYYSGTLSRRAGVYSQ